MKKQRVVVLMHKELMPPDSLEGVSPKEHEKWRTEFDVVQALRSQGHEVIPVGLEEEILPIRVALEQSKPDIVFNLIEAFHGECMYDQLVVNYLELMGQPYTGCRARGLMLARDKALSKKVLSYHRVPVPKFAVFPVGKKMRRPRHLEFPLIVKSLVEEASYGISQASVVDTDEKLQERIAFIHNHIQTDAIVEEYIDGREVYVGIMGTERLKVLPTWEIDFNNMLEGSNRIATEKVKWDKKYQERHGIKWKRADVDEAFENKLAKLSKRIYRRLHLSGYARLDYRVSAEGQFYLLEANPNPNIAKNDEFATSAKALGIEYGPLIDKILQVGLRLKRRMG